MTSNLFVSIWYQLFMMLDVHTYIIVSIFTEISECIVSLIKGI